MLIAGSALAAANAPSAPTPAPGRDSVLVADSLAWRLVPMAVIAPSGDGRGQVIEASGVVADAFGRVVITDAALHRLQRFDAAGRWLGESGSLGSDPGQFRRPGPVVMLGALSVAVLDRENRRVESYDLFGRRLGTVVDLSDAALVDRIGRIEPLTLAADRGGALYVADSERDRVIAFDFSGRYLRTIGGFGARPGSFRGLGGLTVAADGGLVTAERVNARVQRLDAAGRVTASWALPASRLPGAMPVAIDDSARVAVGDEAAGKLWLFDGSGRLLAATEGLARPRSLAFAPDGTLLVAEAAGPVRRFTRVRAAPAPRGD
jgi:DNA-binding beta-propeller fold protein YncE